MLARGAVISALVSIFILPSVLLACEGFIAKTSHNWRSDITPPPRTRLGKRLKELHAKQGESI